MHLPKFIFSCTLSAAIFCLTLFTHQAYSQLIVSPNQTAAILSSNLAGPGITISSPVLTCPGVANGTFTVTPGTLLGTGTTAFGINSGIVLTSGKAAQTSGTESFLANTNNGSAGDAALTILAGATTHDACILEFDFSVVGDSIKFNYQFGSEEYNNSTCGPYNDAFAFFISGPGIVGTDNMALVPGTTIPVTVNSVNNGTPGSGYTLANCTVMGPGSPFATYYVDNTGGANFTYKGYTTKLSAVHKVIPCQTYHLKLTVADAGNYLYDSGVFIEAGSLTTPNITGDSSVCVGNTTTLSDALSGGTWSSSSTSVATIGTSSGTIIGVSAGTTTITYSFGIGCFVTKSFTVNPLPASISGTTTLCTGTTTTLSDLTPGGTWTSSNTLIAAINSVTGFLTAKAAGVISINYKLSTGCTIAIPVTVNLSPAAIKGNTTVCAGATTLLSDVTTPGTWSSSTTSVAGIGFTSGLVTGISAGTTTITYTQLLGCIATTIVFVKPIYTGVLNASICPGKSYSFGGSVYAVAGSYPHTFTTSTCDSIVTLNLTLNPVSNTALNKNICEGDYYLLGSNYYSKSGKYVYVTTNVYGCDSIVTLNLIVSPAPKAPIIKDPVFYCQYEKNAVQLTATGTDLNWYTSPAGGAASKTAPIPSTLSAGTIEYYVSQFAGGCESPRDTFKVVIYPAPDATIKFSNNSVCRKDTINFSSLLQANSTYLWTFPTGTNIIKGSATMWGPITIQFDTTGYFPVKLTVITNGTQCTYSDSIKIHAVVAPEIRLGSKTDVCLGDTVVVALSSITPGITNYVWDFGDATIISATDAVHGGPYKVMWVNSGRHNITVYGMVSELCLSKNAYDTINVHEPPKALIDKSSVPGAAVCMGDSLLFAALDFVPENMYTWAPDHFFHNLNKPEIYGRIELPGYITLTVTDPFGCNATDRVMINAKACCNVAFPTMFTPNGDGKNDLFRPITIGHHPIHDFRVVNRWGQTVFETVNEQEGWDGTFNGVPQDTNTYFYYIKYDCNGKTIEDKGDVTLVR